MTHDGAFVAACLRCDKWWAIGRVLLGGWCQSHWLVANSIFGLRCSFCDKTETCIHGNRKKRGVHSKKTVAFLLRSTGLEGSPQGAGDASPMKIRVNKQVVNVRSIANGRGTCKPVSHEADGIDVAGVVDKTFDRRAGHSGQKALGALTSGLGEKIVRNLTYQLGNAAGICLNCFTNLQGLNHVFNTRSRSRPGRRGWSLCILSSCPGRYRAWF
jgi:hypothetical protein